MDQEKEPIIPCVYCGHPNTASHRFCGMCGKALPDLVKLGPKPGTTVSPLPGAGIGGANRAPQPASPTVSSPPPRPQAAGSRTSTENPNRDLTYLLRDDHVPPPTNRLPFIVGSLLLVAVAAFFAMRGGGKPAPAITDPAVSDSAASAPDSTAAVTDSHPSETSSKSAPADPVKTEAPKTEPAPSAPPVAEETPTATPPSTAPAHAPEPKHARVPAPVAVAKKAPAPASRKPSPAKQAAAPAEEVVPEIATTNGDCDKQVASLRKAAARGDAKARANLGLVYYVGRCVPRDLPTAYHWYALVLRTEPDSPQISAQLEAIWKQMSPAERQLALKPQ